MVTAENLRIWPLAVLVVMASGVGGRGQTVHHVSASRVIALTPAAVADHQPPVVTDVALQPNGQLMATVGDDHVVRIWDLGEGRVLRQLRSHEDWVRVAAFSPDGRVLATAGNDRQIILWEPQTGQRIRRLSLPQAVATLMYSPDGKQIATAGFGSQLWLLDSASGDVVREFECECQDMRCVAFSPDGSQLAAAGRDGQVHVWHVADGRLLHHIAASPRRIRGLTFNHGGNRIVTAGEDRELRVFAVETGKELFHLSTQPAKVLAIAAYAPARLATAGSDNAIHLWDLDERREMACLEGHTGSVAALDYRDDLLVSGSFDTTVRIWPVGENPLRDNRADRRRGEIR